MPQLILHPWFLIFLFTWTSFLFFTPKKILSYTTLNSFIPDLVFHQIPSWTWPWQ
uniref:ATP synthase complex subunit 8 n=1 Tax=Cornufer vitiensis TaxID=58512 RepID=A0A0K0LG02_9NEOB|nr:ATP synthase F0 subunit 8 [Cornufer vitiensis]